MTYLQYVIENVCPADVLTITKPILDPDTYMDPDTGAMGCRGITCEQCWNQEIMKPLDK